MSSFRTEWPAAPNFHPEFGYLCPSPRRRRRTRLVLAAAMAALVVGGAVGLAVEHRGDSEGLAPTVQSDTQTDSARASTSAADVAASAASTQNPCKSDASKDPAGSFLALNCPPSKLHARHGARAAYRVAILTPGRTDARPSPPGATPVTTTANEPARVEKPAQVDRAKPRPKKPRPSAGVSLAREPSRQNAVANAYAYEPYYDWYRSNSPQYGFGGPFGRR